MTNEEHHVAMHRELADIVKRIEVVRERVEANEEKTNRIFRALLEVPDGSPKDQKPFMEAAWPVIYAFDRSKWLARTTVWFILLSASLAGALQVLWKWLVLKDV